MLYKTQSLCPVCLKKIDAGFTYKGGNTVMQKVCPDHGVFEATVWKGGMPMADWMSTGKNAPGLPEETPSGCPYECGLCGSHRQHTCTALIEVTARCNLHCRFCFADSNAGGKKDPSADEITSLYKSVLKNSGLCNIQLSGGEPTLRDDLPMLVQNGKELGFQFIQINTNGIRIAKDERFVKDLKTAGVDSLFLQFDGTEDAIYRQLRGQDLLAIKTRAIENCKKYGIGVVLVPTLVPDVNVYNIGAIIDFALDHIEAVREVHFQPVSYFGRIPHAPLDRDRITLPELMAEIETQTDGRVRADSMKPPQCENALCSFHGRYLYEGNHRLTAIAPSSSCGCHAENTEAKEPQSCCCGQNSMEEETQNCGCQANNQAESQSCGCCADHDEIEEAQVCCCPTQNAKEGAVKAKAYVSKNWGFREQVQEETADGGWNDILNYIHGNSFAISAMAFQDVWNVDLNRVMDCCIHVVTPEGKLIPFCLYNITDTQGNPLYRRTNEALV